MPFSRSASALLAALAAALPTGAQAPLFVHRGDLVAATPERDLASAIARVAAGPTPRERALGWSSAVPARARLLAVRDDDDGGVTMVFDDALLAAVDGGGIELAIEQLAKTAFGRPDVRRASIAVRGADGVERDLGALLARRQPRPDPAAPPPGARRQPAHAASPGANGPTGTDLPRGQGALAGRRIAISPGHGYYWHSSLGWTTQRPVIDGLVEDVHTAEICNRWLVPLLENLGATVLECREHGEVPVEAIADDGAGAPGYVETGAWSQSASSGWQGGSYRFAGVAPAASATATWTVPVARSGVHPVYAFFRAGTNRAPDAHFTIHHTGGATTIEVDQTRDDRTWVWLGDFAFAAGTPARIELDNASATAGRVVIADAVRVGGGLGSIARGAGPSGRPRWQECARYWAEFAGAPGSVWNSIGGGEDNDDDVTARPRYAEWRGADAFVSLHTNAGGGLGTSTYIHDTAPSAGSATLRQRVHGQLIADLRAEYLASWTDRGQLAANFGEVRLLSTMPGILIELAFHDTPGSVDHRALHDPRFRYLAARAIARGVLRHFAPNAPFPPEPPAALRVVQDGARGLLVAWDGSPGATGYTVEWSPDGKGFVPVASVASTSWSTGPLPHHTLRSFRVRATNASGCSVPTEVLTAGTDHLGAAQVLLVQGFDRLDRYVKAPDNTRDYLGVFGDAIRAAPFSLGFDAASNEAVRLARVPLPGYRAVLWASGEESTQHETFDLQEQALVQAYLAGGGRLFASGAEIAWDLDAQGTAADRAFLRGSLGAAYAADDAGTYLLQAGVPGTLFDGLPAGTFDDGTAGTYDVDWPDVLAPADPASTVCLRYGNGLVAGLQRSVGGSRVVLLGLPFETIVQAPLRAALLERVLRFLLDPLPLSLPATTRIGQRLPIAIRTPQDAGAGYLLFASDGHEPGIALPGGAVLPLRPGFLLTASLDPQNPFFGNFVGALDAQGAANAHVDVPALPFLTGLQVTFGGLSLDPTGLAERTVWNWCRCTLVP